jgi:hypothetical protein
MTKADLDELYAADPRPTQGVVEVFETQSRDVRRLVEEHIFESGRLLERALGGQARSLGLSASGLLGGLSRREELNPNCERSRRPPRQRRSLDQSERLNQAGCRSSVRTPCEHSNVPASARA